MIVQLPRIALGIPAGAGAVGTRKDPAVEWIHKSLPIEMDSPMKSGRELGAAVLSDMPANSADRFTLLPETDRTVHDRSVAVACRSQPAVRPDAIFYGRLQKPGRLRPVSRVACEPSPVGEQERPLHLVAQVDHSAVLHRQRLPRRRIALDQSAALRARKRPDEA